MHRRHVDAFAAGCLLLSLFPVVSARLGPGQHSAKLEIPDEAINISATGVNGCLDIPTTQDEDMAPPKDAPNVFMILIDDAGFGATSPFGGPIPTPTFEALANRGLRYTKFHTTALCSPTRAALLTGRNHHSVHSGVISEASTGFPGYDTLMTKDKASVGEILKQVGYNTAWLGKNHHVPAWQRSKAGPFNLWATGLGFDYFKGFIGGQTSQWRPVLYEGSKPIEPYLDNADYNLNNDLANTTISYIEEQHALVPDKPFFVYYAPGATHAPHHVPKEWIAKFKGQFDHGWDEQRMRTFAKQKEMGIFPPDAKMTDRPESLPAYDDASPDQKKVYARMMEVYAAFMAHTDYEIGRIVQRIKELGKEDNTLVLLMIGDNGASGEGTVEGLANEMTSFNSLNDNFDDLLLNLDELGSERFSNHYPAGWAHAMNTPFQWVKQVASHYGGTRNPMVVSWPAKITEENYGQLRDQWHHVIDVAPTILEAIGIPPPSMVNGVVQKPHEGVSMLYTFLNASAPSTRETQYFEMLGNQGIYDKGWTAQTTPVAVPWQMSNTELDPISGYDWELYNVAEDPTQSNNLAGSYPGKLEDLRTIFTMEATKYNVYPIDNRRTARFNDSNRPSLMYGRNEVTFFKGMIRTPEVAAPDTKNKDFSIIADTYLPSNSENGVLATMGGRYGGWVIYLKNGYLKYHYNLAAKERYEVKSTDKVPSGNHQIELRFVYDGGHAGGGGVATLYVDGASVGEGRIHKTLCCFISMDETFDVGSDTGTAASPDYEVPNDFKGVLRSLKIFLPTPAVDVMREE
ncbi:sulfatase [Nannochloropsis oceanica]